MGAQTHYEKGLKRKNKEEQNPRNPKSNQSYPNLHTQTIHPSIRNRKGANKHKQIQNPPKPGHFKCHHVSHRPTKLN